MNQIQNILLIIFSCTFLVCCSRGESSSYHNSTGNLMVSGDSLRENRIDPDTVQSGSDLEDPDSQVNFIVSVAEGYNYESLKQIAVKTAKLTHFKFDQLGRVYLPKRGIVVPDNDEDEMWAGSYFLRRTGDNVVSIEMRNAYIDTSLIHKESELEALSKDTSRMFVFAMMYPDKRKSDSLVKVLKPHFPKTKIIAADIFMGCMH